MHFKENYLKKQNSNKWILFGTVILLIAIVMFVYSLKSSPLKGTWSMDDVTTYEFYNHNKGAMILPSVEYEFTYIIEENCLFIDFAYEGAKDAEYIFEIEGNSLILEGGNATTKGRYVLTKN